MPPTARSHGCGSSATTRSRSRTTLCGDSAAGPLFAEQLDRLDAALEERPWVGGGEYGLADIAYAPWVLRARDRMGVALDPYPALEEWLKRLLERPAVAEEEHVVARL